MNMAKWIAVSIVCGFSTSAFAGFVSLHNAGVINDNSYSFSNKAPAPDVLDDLYTFTTGDVGGTVDFSLNSNIDDVYAVFHFDGGKTLIGSGSPEAATLSFVANSTYSIELFGDGGPDLSYGLALSNVQLAAVPEPETYALMGLGLVALVAARGRALKVRRGAPVSHAAEIA